MFSLGVSDTIWTGIIDQVRAAVSIPCLYLTFYHPTRDIFDDESVQYVLRDHTSYFFSLPAPAALKFASPAAGWLAGLLQHLAL